MLTAAAASGPETRKAGTGMPAPHNSHCSSGDEISFHHCLTQRESGAPRIIATHWLRAELTEAAYG